VKVLIYFIAMVAIGVAVGCDGDSNNGGETGGDGGITITDDHTPEICELTANGLEWLADEVHGGESVAAAIQFLGAGACVYLAKAAFNDPFKDVTAKIELPSEESIYFEGTAEELVTPAQEPEPSRDIDIERLIACVKSYSVQFLFDKCADEYIEP
jgi:hypothetical protein